MKLMQLRFFQAACQYRNITRAAEALHISQPSISNAVKELEGEFGVQLLHRLNRGFSLTSEGETLLAYADRLLGEADDLTRVMSSLGHKRQLIRLGVPPMIGAMLFPQLYKGFGQAHPQIKLATQEAGSQMLLEALREDRLDIAILPSNSLSPEEYKLLPIARTETVFCVSARHPLAGRQSVTLPEIQKEPLVMFDNGFYQNQMLRNLYQEYQLTPPTVHHSGQLQTIRQFIVDEIACGFMFRELAQDTPGMVPLSMEPPLPITISLVWRHSQPMFGGLMAFIDYARSGVWKGSRNQKNL